MQKKSTQAHHLDEHSQANVEMHEVEEISHLEEGLTSQVNHLGRNKPFYMSLEVNGKTIVFEVDTGSPWTIISQETYEGIRSLSAITKSDVSLRTYTGSSVPIVGEAKVRVQHKGQSKQLPLLVVREVVSSQSLSSRRRTVVFQSRPSVLCYETQDR